MEAYSDFAYIYDIFMEEVPYDEWAELLSSLIDAYGNGEVHDKLSVVDLACGTGRLTSLMYKKGFINITGVDMSNDMLSVAMDNAIGSDEDILYINQDMRELSLINDIDVIYSSFDSINYILTNEDIIEVFRRVKDSLKKDGLFIFDFNTLYKYEAVIGDDTIAEDREDCAFIWENFFDSETHINEYDITFFVRENDSESFRRFYETHTQRGYTLLEMKNFLDAAGLKFVYALDSSTKKEPTDQSERIHIIARG